MRPAFMDATGQLHPVQGAGHVNVGKQQPHLWGRLENIECGLSIGRFDDTKSLILKDVGCQKTQRIFVLRDQDDWLCLWVWMALDHGVSTRDKEVGFKINFCSRY